MKLSGQQHVCYTVVVFKRRFSSTRVLIYSVHMINDNPVSPITPNITERFLLDSVSFVSQTLLVGFVEVFDVSLEIAPVVSLEMSVIN